MITFRISKDVEECEKVWSRMWPALCLFDLWPVRSCFADAYDRQPAFVIAEEHGKTVGLLALAEIDTKNQFGFYPAETWQSKTWLEQNKIPVSRLEILPDLLAAVPGPAHLRYLSRESVSPLTCPVAVDEVGYLFLPATVDFSFTNYMQLFSGKSRKKLGREIAALEAHGISYRYNDPADIDLVFRMNHESFGDLSYFADPRFAKAFSQLTDWLRINNMLRVTTILLGGTVAAIDIGAVWRNNYTLLAGCTNPEFLGIAKLINLHHIRTACQEKMTSVDFLCGDFNWKKRFHLSERPLYEMHIRPYREQMVPDHEHKNIFRQHSC